MKKLSLLLIVITAVSVSCKKYEGGPLVSLKSKKARLTRTWDVQESLTQGQYIFENNGDLEITLPNQAVESEPYATGTWEFSAKKDYLKISYMTVDRSNSQEDIDSQEMKIWRLTSKDLWLGDDIGVTLLMEKAD